MNVNIIVAPVEQYLLTSRLARNRRKEGSVAVRRRKAFISRVEHSLSHGAVRTFGCPTACRVTTFIRVSKVTKIGTRWGSGRRSCSAASVKRSCSLC